VRKECKEGKSDSP
jgi:hypothetical protein